MFKLLDRIFNGKPEEQKKPEVVVTHPIDWVLRNVSQSQRKDYHQMVSEPIITLINSMKANRRRFRISEITTEEYYSNPRHGEIHKWFKKGTTKFFIFVDKVSGINHTIVVNNGCLYRVDDLPFTLNAWEINTLSRAYYIIRQETSERITRRKAENIQRKRKIREELEKADRLKYQRSFE